MKYKMTILLILLSIFSLALAACYPRPVEIGLTETTQPGRWQAAYTTFDGQKYAAVDLQTGQELSLAYQVEVEKGRLVLQVEAPDEDILFAESFQSDHADRIELSPGQAGRYTIEITGQDTGGGWTLDWQAR